MCRLEWLADGHRRIGPCGQRRGVSGLNIKRPYMEFEMAITMDQLSPPARELLTVALTGRERHKGVIWFSADDLSAGEGLRITAGGKQANIASLVNVQTVIDELLTEGLIVKFMVGDEPRGYIVTPFGCEVSKAPGG